MRSSERFFKSGSYIYIVLQLGVFNFLKSNKLFNNKIDVPPSGVYDKLFSVFVNFYVFGTI